MILGAVSRRGDGCASDLRDKLPQSESERRASMVSSANVERLSHS